MSSWLQGQARSFWLSTLPAPLRIFSQHLHSQCHSARRWVRQHLCRLRKPHSLETTLGLNVFSSVSACKWPEHALMTENLMETLGRKRICKAVSTETLCGQTSGRTPVITHLERVSHKGILCMNGLEEQVSGPTGVQLILKSQFTITIILWAAEQISLKKEGNRKLEEKQTH